ncbi:MAG: xanthine dehydrogenase family protein molybdopterin-binding subunit, partial [Terriglobales bacterium]
MDHQARKFMYVGKPLKRREDVKFLTGRGHYVDDLSFPDMAYIAFVRSPHAHARIRRIGTEAARALPGVLRVLTAQDWVAAGHGKIPCLHPMPFSDGRPMNEALRQSLAVGKVRYVGEIVAAVVAASGYVAVDAAEAVEVDYEPLPAVSDTAKTLDPDAVIIHEALGTNLVNETIRGDRAATDAAFARAAHVTALSLTSQRVAGMPMEPRSLVATHDAATGETVLWA